MRSHPGLMIAVLALSGCAAFALSKIGSSSNFCNVQAPATAPTNLSPEQLKEDFQIARRALEEGHSGIYRYTSKAEMDRAFDQAARSLDSPMDALEFFRILAPTVARIKCGHTAVVPDETTRKDINNTLPLLPFQVRVLNSKPYIFRDFADLAASNKSPSLAGREIRSINGVPASKIISTMLAAIPADGDVQSSRQYRIGSWSFNSILFSLSGIKSPFEVVVAGADSKQQTIHVEGVPRPKLLEASRNRYPQDQEPSRGGELKFYDDGRIAQIVIHQFGAWADPERKLGFRDFYKESFEAIHSKGSKALIIDLRNNGGGEDELGQLLLSYLVDKPFKYYDDLVINSMAFSFSKYAGSGITIPEKLVETRADGKVHAIGHPNWGTKQPNQPTFTGKVFILINGGSFSTTSEFLSQAHFHHRATFIGQESAGGYYGNSSGFMPLITLPNSKVGVRIPLMTYYMAVSGYTAASHGIVPDYVVDYTIEEMLAGTDKDVTLALQLARKN
jgi:peptidase S41-like protein